MDDTRQPRTTRFVDTARRIAREAAMRASALDQDEAWPEKELAALRRGGLLEAALPSASGGAGLGTEPDGAAVLCQVLRAIGWGSLVLGRLYEGHVNTLRLIADHGDAAQCQRLAADVRDGRLMAVWNTELEPGLRLRGRGAGWVLEGAKTFASGAGRVTRPLVTARDEEGRLLMILPRLAEGGGVSPTELGERADLAGWRAHGMRATATGRFDFSGIAVAASDRLGGDGDYHREPAFSGGAWRFLAVQAGAVERLTDELRRYLRASGRGDDPHQKARLGRATMAAETARLWVERSAHMVESATGTSEAAGIVAYVRLARGAVEAAALEVMELCHRSIGLAGFLRSHPIEQVSRDLATYLRQPAPDAALTGAAAWLLAQEADLAAVWEAEAADAG